LATFAAAILVTMSSSTVARANEHSLEPALDLASDTARDDTLVPLAHSGLRAAVLGSYVGDYGKLLTVADARTGLGIVSGAHAEFGATLTWRVNLGVLFPLGQHGASGWALGPSVGTDNETFYFGDWDDAHPYWIGATWLGPRYYAWTRLNADWAVRWDVQAALAGLLSRPPAYRKTKQETSDSIWIYASAPMHEPSLAWFDEFQVLRALISFHRDRAGRVTSGLGQSAAVPKGWGLGSELTLVHASRPASAFSLELGLRFSYAWGF
jgi:hypothetical protein